MKPIFFIISCLGLCAGLGFVSLSTATSGPSERFADKANLALRQVGHQLLQLEGDEHSAIPPVRMAGPGEFILELKTAFNYDTLPQLLSQALLSYNIRRDYHVVVKRCSDDIPILGYNQAAVARGQVPCVGREQEVACSNIILTFTVPSHTLAGIPALPFSMFLLTALMGIGGVILWRKKNTTSGPASTPDSGIPLGRFLFDHQNQTLRRGEEQQELTFRESKLLDFLTRHVNEVVTRDKLIAEVWGDEGVIVGRSLDVFISRLRKHLKGDEAVAIKSIHGVGYRLEVAGG